mgnify:CR=1 FL=1
MGFREWRKSTKGILLFIILWFLFLLIVSFYSYFSNGGTCSVQFYPTAPVNNSAKECFLPLILGMTLGIPIIAVGSTIFGLIGHFIEKRQNKNSNKITIENKKVNGMSKLLVIVIIIAIIIVIKILFTFIRMSLFLGTR